MSPQKKTSPKKPAKQQASPAAALRAFALGLPGATEHFPWGERVVKVNKKVFVFLGHDDTDKAGLSAKKSEHVGAPGEWGMSVKLPKSGKAVVAEKLATPTGYGLGKAGWVSFTFGPKDKPALARLEAFIEESYRAVANKSRVADLDELRAG